MSRRENEQVREDSTLNDWNMAGNLHTIKKNLFLYFFVPHSFWIVLVLIYTTSLSIIYRAQSLQTHSSRFTLLSWRSFLRFYFLSADLICGILFSLFFNLTFQWYSSFFFIKNIHNIEGAYTHWILRIKKHS